MQEIKYEIISKLINDKLKLEDIKELEKYLIGIMYTSPKGKEVSLPYNTLENLDISKGLLTEEEKEIIITFIWISAFLKTKNKKNYIDTISSKEEFLDLKNEFNEKLFSFKNEVRKLFPVSGEFGYEITNPIQVNCMRGITKYFNKLETINGKSIKWDRLYSSPSDIFDGPTDLYEIKVVGLMQKKYKLYINCYSDTVSTIAPKGFKFIS